MIAPTPRLRVHPVALGSSIGGAVVLLLTGGTTLREWGLYLTAWAFQVLFFGWLFPEDC